jgi:hypothetical protein
MTPDPPLSALRAMLAGDSEGYEKVTRQIAQGEKSWDFGILVASAFCVAVQRRFAGGYTSADVIHLVADERTRFNNPDRDFDPRIAERLIRAALGHGSAEGLPESERARIQIAFLMGLVADADLDEEGLAEFMAAARKLADAAIPYAASSQRWQDQTGPPA